MNKSDAEKCRTGFSYLLMTPDERRRLDGDIEHIKECLETLEGEAGALLTEIISAQEKEKKAEAERIHAKLMRTDASYRRRISLSQKTKKQEMRAVQSEREAMRAAEAIKQDKLNKWQAQHREKTRRLTRIGKAVVSLFDSVKVAGVSIGDVWYSELAAIKKQGLFEASLCDAIIKHGKPSKDAKVRDVISEKTLAALISTVKGSSARTMKAAA